MSTGGFLQTAIQNLNEDHSIFHLNSSVPTYQLLKPPHLTTLSTPPRTMTTPQQERVSIFNALHRPKTDGLGLPNRYHFSIQTLPLLPGEAIFLVNPYNNHEHTEGRTRLITLPPQPNKPKPSSPSSLLLQRPIRQRRPHLPNAQRHAPLGPLELEHQRPRASECRLGMTTRHRRPGGAVRGIGFGSRSCGDCG